MTKGRQNTDSSTARKKHGEKELVNGFLLTCLESILEKCSSVTKVIQKEIPQLRGSRGKQNGTYFRIAEKAIIKDHS